MQRRVVERPDFPVCQGSNGLLAQFGSEVDQVVHGNACQVIRSGLGRERLRRRQFLAWHQRLRYRTLFDRPQRLACFAVEGEQQSLLGGLRDGLDGAAILLDVDQDRCSRNVVVPDIVVHQLEVPATLTCLRIECDQTGTEQRVTRTETAVVIHCRRVGGDVDQAQFRIG